MPNLEKVLNFFEKNGEYLGGAAYANARAYKNSVLLTVHKNDRSRHVMARIKHPNIPKLYLVGERDHYAYFLMPRYEIIDWNEPAYKTGGIEKAHVSAVTGAVEKANNVGYKLEKRNKFFNRQRYIFFYTLKLMSEDKKLLKKYRTAFKLILKEIAKYSNQDPNFYVPGGVTDIYNRNLSRDNKGNIIIRDPLVVKYERKY